MKKIPLKNYIIYLSICLLTFLFLFFFINRVKRMDITRDSVLSGFLYEVTQDDFFLNIKNYAVDNPVFILYISNHNYDSFDEEFKEYILTYNIKNIIVYFNGWNKLDNKFANTFKTEFFSSDLLGLGLNSIKQSNLYTYQDGKVIDVLYKDKRAINIDDVKLYLESSDIYD